MLSAQFERSNAEEVTVGYGQPAVVSGRLANNAGDPIRGAKLCVKMATIGRRRSRRECRLGHHRRRWPLSLRGAARARTAKSRSAIAMTPRRSPATCATTPTPDRACGSATRGSQNGERVRFWGALPGPRNAGRVVVLQAGTVGSKRWITFRKATSEGPRRLPRQLPLHPHDPQDEIPVPGGRAEAGRVPVGRRAEQAGGGAGRAGALTCSGQARRTRR